MGGRPNLNRFTAADIESLYATAAPPESTRLAKDDVFPYEQKWCPGELLIDVRAEDRRTALKYLLKLGDGDLALGRSISAQRGVRVVNVQLRDKLWQEEEVEARRPVAVTIFERREAGKRQKGVIVIGGAVPREEPRQRDLRTAVVQQGLC